VASIILANAFFNVTVVVRTVVGLWTHLDARAVDAARALGASPWRAFRSVTLPSLAPAIASGWLFGSTMRPLWTPWRR
jgi:thiamine transport system permease protein